jgi:N-methylhydantoinase B/oxoprolinase/acetone carboxylase alpha subunit
MLETTGVSSTGDNRSGDPPRGLFGGEHGKPGSITVNRGTDKHQDLPAKISHSQLQAGDRLEIQLVCSAGYGDPMQRDELAVLDDVLDDFISSDDAREQYGVVLNKDGRSIDIKQTQGLRIK